MEEKNKKIVGIVVVSHSNKLAEEIINFVKIFKQTDFPLENGGNANREVYGTNIENVKNAIIRADNGAGVLVFVDMGSSVFNAVKAIKELDGEVEAKIADAPLVEGIISAVAANFDGIDLDELKIIAEDSEEEFKAAFRENTKILFGETLGNPEMNTLNFEKIVKIAKEKDVPTIIDNTLATPYLCNPISYGINIVVHSATKYIDGQGSVLGGVIVDGGNYNWDNGKFPMLVEPDVSYHNMSYYKTFGNLAYIIKARANILRDMGAALSPFNAFILLRGLETLHLRMERHSENALALATALEKNPNITWVKYSKLPSHYAYKNAEKYLPKGGSGVILVGVKGGREGAEKFIKGLEWIRAVVHVGDSRTCLLHPASTTHRQLSEEDLIKCGVLPEAVRINVGIENINDIIADIEQALAKL